MKRLVINQSTFTRYYNLLSKTDSIKDWRILSEKFHSMEEFVQAKLADLVKLRIEWTVILKRFFTANKAELKKQDLGTWSKFVSHFFGIEETQVKYYTRAAEIVVNDLEDIEKLSLNLKAAYKMEVDAVKDAEGRVKRTEDGLRVLEKVEKDETTTATDAIAELEKVIERKEKRKFTIKKELKELEAEIPALKKELAELKKS